VYAKHNVYVLSVAWKGNDFTWSDKYFWACEIFFTLYQMNTQLITNVNFVELSFFKVGTSCTIVHTLSYTCHHLHI
jgi:hypothetical protein